MIKKLFVSQPMRDVPEEEILKKREEAKKYIQSLYPDYTIEVIQSYQPTGKTEYNALSAVNLLGSSISKMAFADIIYFAPGWKESKGCQIENEVARRWLEEANIELIEDGMEKVDLEIPLEDLQALTKMADEAGMSIHKFVSMKLEQALKDGTVEKIAEELKNAVNDNSK